MSTIAAGISEADLAEVRSEFRSAGETVLQTARGESKTEANVIRAAVSRVRQEYLHPKSGQSRYCIASRHHGHAVSKGLLESWGCLLE